MSKIHSKALGESIEVGRYIGKFENDPSLSTVVFIGGIHGNEPSGVFGLHEVCEHLRNDKIQLTGNFYALSGNLCALPEGRRFCDIDLNRIWTKDNVNQVEQLTSPDELIRKEDVQMNSLLKEIKYIINRSKGPIYFIDLHTTSSKSCPFIPMNDTIANRRFARKFPVPTVLGLEEFLEGPLMSYINELNHVAIGFEGGQHDDKASITNQIAFISLVLLYTNCVDKKALPNYQHYINQLTEAGRKERGIYEIRHRYEIMDNELFDMIPGFESFDRIHKDQAIARYDGDEVLSLESGKIFMPLYQSQGNDGFFIIRKISYLWLKLSTLLRKLRVESVLILLPGVTRDPSNRKTLVVKRKIARYLSKEIFHLLGFRIKQRNPEEYRFTRREVI